MPLSDHVQLTISQDTVGIARAGFGVPMILSVNATWPERLRYYTDLSGVGDDFDSDTPEYLAARAMFSQDPHPARIAIGRAAGQPTLAYAGEVVNIKNSHAYKIVVVGTGFTTTTITSTSDSSALNDEIVADIVDKLNAIVDKNFTAAVVPGVGDTDTFTVTGNAAGDWFSLAVVDVTDLHLTMTHAEPATTLATDLDAIRLEQDDWYGLCTLYNSDAYVKAAAAWAESQFKVYVAASSDAESITTAAGNGELLDDLNGLNYKRTMGAYHASPAEFMDAAWLGRCLPLEPGSETWKFKTLVGVTADPLTPTHYANLIDRSANGYYTVAGLDITFEGTTGDGGFLDTTRGLDWLTDDMSKAVFGALAGPDKVPFTDAGVAVIENEVRGSLRRAVAKGILADDPEPRVSAPLVKDVDTTNKALRLLPDVKFSATLAGAIHSVSISGVVSV